MQDDSRNDRFQPIPLPIRRRRRHTALVADKIEQRRDNSFSVGLPKPRGSGASRQNRPLSYQALRLLLPAQRRRSRARPRMKQTASRQSVQCRPARSAVTRRSSVTKISETVSLNNSCKATAPRACGGLVAELQASSGERRL